MEQEKATQDKRDGKRVYQTEDLIVYWDAKQCAHVGNCWRGLPQVFRPSERPWILMDKATPEEIIKTIDTCPTEALHYELPAGSKVDPTIARGKGALEPQSQSTGAVEIKTSANGPLIIAGNARIYSPEGELLRESERMVLCSCGKSGKKPFCDGSHLR